MNGRIESSPIAFNGHHWQHIDSRHRLRKPRDRPAMLLLGLVSGTAEGGMVRVEEHVQRNDPQGVLRQDTHDCLLVEESEAAFEAVGRGGGAGVPQLLFSVHAERL